MNHPNSRASVKSQVTSHRSQVTSHKSSRAIGRMCELNAVSQKNVAKPSWKKLSTRNWIFAFHELEHASNTVGGEDGNDGESWRWDSRVPLPWQLCRKWIYSIPFLSFFLFFFRNAKKKECKELCKAPLRADDFCSIYRQYNILTQT